MAPATTRREPLDFQVESNTLLSLYLKSSTHPHVEEPLRVLVVGEQRRVLPVCRIILTGQGVRCDRPTGSIGRQSIPTRPRTLVNVDGRHLGHVPHGRPALPAPATAARRLVLLPLLAPRGRPLGREGRRYPLPLPLLSRIGPCWYYPAAAAAGGAADAADAAGRRWPQGCLAMGMMMPGVIHAFDSIRAASPNEPAHHSTLSLTCQAAAAQEAARHGHGVPVCAFGNCSRGACRLVLARNAIHHRPSRAGRSIDCGRRRGPPRHRPSDGRGHAKPEGGRQGGAGGPGSWGRAQSQGYCC